ncbi:MAG: hypothetical protein V2A53_10880 [bacterium]
MRDSNLFSCIINGNCPIIIILKDMLTTHIIGTMVVSVQVSAISRQQRP